MTWRRAVAFGPGVDACRPYDPADPADPDAWREDWALMLAAVALDAITNADGPLARTTPETYSDEW